MAELTQQQWEARQLQASQARDRLFHAIAQQPDPLELWRAWRESEAQLIDAGRARRESEVQGD